MPDTTTTLLKLVKIEVGGSANTWGDKEHTTLDGIDAIYRDVGGDLVTGGAANAYTVTPAFGNITAYADGLHFRVRFHAAVTTASTLNYDGIGAADLKKKSAGVAAALASGDAPAGHYGDIIYSETDTAFLLLNPGGNPYTVGGTDVAIADGGTGQSTATLGFNALSPVTTRGDLIVRGATNNDRLAVGTSTQVLRSDGTDTIWGWPLETWAFAASDETTAITATANKVRWVFPYAVTVVSVAASLSTAQTSGNIFTVDIHEAGTTILSTKITIDNTEKDTSTALAAAVISDAAIAAFAEMTVDVDQIGDGTAKGLKVYMIVRRTA